MDQQKSRAVINTSQAQLEKHKCAYINMRLHQFEIYLSSCTTKIRGRPQISS